MEHSVCGRCEAGARHGDVRTYFVNAGERRIFAEFDLVADESDVGRQRRRQSGCIRLLVTSWCEHV